MDFQASSLVVITGASRGLGKVIAEALSNKLQRSCHFLLTSSSKCSIEAVAESLLSTYTRHTYTSKPCDLSSREQVSELCEYITSLSKDISKYEAVVLVHNAGSIGQINKFAEDLQKSDLLETYTYLNFISVIRLNAAFLKLADKSSAERVIINISSLAADCAQPNWTEYCSMKAARDMAFKVLSEENPGLRILTYSPGPLETEMMVQVRKQWVGKEQVKNWPFVDCKETVRKMVSLLEENQFQNAQRIDYYDE